MRQKINWLVKTVLSHKLEFAFFFLLLAVHLINTVHTSYPDEFDNIVGGHFINQGKLPYTGFFTHHGPVAYFFASILMFFSGASFVNFRIALAIAYFLMLLGSYLFFRKRFGGYYANLYMAFTAFVAIAATYFWGHMLLADTLVGYLLTPVYILLFLSFVTKRVASRADLIFISILCFLSLLTSITFLYAVLILYLFSLMWYLISNNYRFFSLNLLRFAFVMSLPYLFFFVYLIISGSWYDFYYQAIYFNKEYYIGDSISSNPIRHMISIFARIIGPYKTLLIFTKDLNFGYPFNITLALANFLLLIYLLINRKFTLSLLVIGLLFYLNARSDPYLSQETDYQALPYDFFSLFNGLFLLTALWKGLGAKLEDNKRFVYGFMLLSLGTYLVFLSLFLFEKFFDKAYLKFEGKQALIYDRPILAGTLNEILSEDDYYWVGPFAFEEHLYTEGKLSSRHFIVIPAMDRSEKIQKELIEDIQKNKPKVVVYHTDFLVLGKKPGIWFVDYLRKDYFTIEELRSKGEEINVKTQSFGNSDTPYDFARYFFFPRERKEEIMHELYQKGLIY